MTPDTLDGQREITRQIVDRGGEHAMALKRNQGILRDDVSSFLGDPKAEATTANTMADGDHGRMEVPGALVSTHIDRLQRRHQWRGLKSVAKFTRRHDGAGKTSCGTVCYLLGQPLPADRFNVVARAHW